MEPYLYVGNNPINFIDPTGMSKVGGGDPPPPSVRQAIYAARFPNIAKGIGTFKSGATNITTNSVRFTLNAKGLQEILDGNMVTIMVRNIIRLIKVEIQLLI